VDAILPLAVDSVPQAILEENGFGDLAGLETNDVGL
jgi:hypothetical protein